MVSAQATGCHWRAAPCVTIIDFSLNKTAPKKKGGRRGCDADKKVKKIKGRKRRIASNMPGPRLIVMTPSAGIQGRAGAGALLAGLFLRLEHLKLIFVDGWADWSIDRFWVRSCCRAGILLPQSRADCGKQAFEMILRKS